MRIPFSPSPSASGSTSAGGKFEETQEDGLRRMREDTTSGGIGLSPEEEGEEYDEFGLTLVDMKDPPPPQPQHQYPTQERGQAGQT